MRRFLRSTWFCTLLLILPTVGQAEVKYVNIHPVREKGLSLRETWDKTGQFCYYRDDGSTDKTCLPITQMGEVKLRDNGDWSTSAQDKRFIDRLSSDEMDDAARFPKLHLRYLAIGPDHRFVIQIFFATQDHHAEDVMSQTIYAMGHLYGGMDRETDPQVESMCFSNPLETSAAVLKAITALSRFNEAPSKSSVQAQIVNDNLSLLKVGAAVIRIYATNFRHASAPAIGFETAQP